jgi:hypothetical protein
MTTNPPERLKMYYLWDGVSTRQKRRNIWSIMFVASMSMAIAQLMRTTNHHYSTTYRYMKRTNLLFLRIFSCALASSCALLMFHTRWLQLAIEFASRPYVLLSTGESYSSHELVHRRHRSGGTSY